ncbi:MAG: nickel-dependent hydrogenase large subunit [Candidatus Altiarchaeota archaeon]
MMDRSNLVEVDVGTVHQVLIEPFRTRFWVEDETVVDCEITYNAAHRGIERLLEGIPIKKAHMIVEKICGLCSHFHLWNSIRVTEKAMGVEVPDRAQYIRVLIAELERIHSHLFFLAHGCETLGQETFTYRSFALREPVMRMLYELTGNRVHYAVPVIGGVRPRSDPTKDTLNKINPLLNTLEKDLKAFAGRVTTDPMVMSRITGIGILDKKTAKELHAVGPTARGSGIDNDMRHEMPEYDDFDFKYIVLKDCDVKDRLLVRFLELFESMHIVRQVLDEIPPGEVISTPKMKFDTEIAATYIEAPRGELFHTLWIDGQGKARNYRIRTPTPPNLASMEKACIGDQLTDALLTIISCDPCLSCSNRALVVDRKTGKERLIEVRR